MPGRVIAVHVAAGDAVEARQPLVVLEAMKMEHVVVAPFPAEVASVAVAVGDQVAPGAILVVLDG
jgi:biotin carboxyl carrier protein